MMSAVFLAVIRAAPSPLPTPEPELPELHDIAPPVEIPTPLWQTILLISLAVLLLALAVWLVWICWPKTLPEPPLSPRQRALAELERLRAQLATRDPREFSFDVSAVLRGFVEQQYGLRALEQTSDEFLAEVSGSSRFSPMDRRLLADFLESSDVIKYARAHAEVSASEALLTNATTFVQGGRM